MTTMKKRTLSITLMIALSIVFSMCMGFSSHASTKSVYKPVIRAYDKIYNHCVSIYKVGMTPEKTGMEVDGYVFSPDGLIGPPTDCYPGIGYTYMDINNDGKKEIIFGNTGSYFNGHHPKNLNKMLIYSIWTQKNGKAKFVKSARSRCYLLVVSPGTICLRVGGGYNYTINKFYKLSGSNVKYIGKRLNGKWEVSESKKITNWKWIA
jgi:hypothetical protein